MLVCVIVPVRAQKDKAALVKLGKKNGQKEVA